MQRTISVAVLVVASFFAGKSSAQSTQYVNGDSVTDNTAAIQAAVNNCSTSCNVILANVVIAGQINLPTSVDINFSSVGTVTVTSSASAFSRTGTNNATPISNRLTFDNMRFSKSNAGIIIQDNLIFSSATNMGITVHGCHFQLGQANAVAIALSGDGGTLISENVFDTGTGLTGTAIETITNNISNNGVVSTPMNVTIANNIFRGGTAFTQVSLATGADPGEGFTFTGNHFVLSKVSASGNEINFVGNEFVGASVSLKDLSNSTFNGNYVDSGNAPGQTLLFLDNVIHQQITSNSFISGGQPNTTFIAFVNPRGLGSGTTTVTLTSNTYVGASNTSSGGIGVLFDDPVARNVYVGAENFRLMWAALTFEATLDRSTIDRFEARDVVYYAQNIATYRGNYLRSDPVYAVYQVHLTGTVYSAAPNVEIGSTTVTFPAMFNNPVVTVTKVADVSTTPCSANIFPSASNSGNSVSHSSLSVSLYSTVGAQLGFVACDALVTLDDSLYVAPR